MVGVYANGLGDWCSIPVLTYIGNSFFGKTIY